MVLWLMCPVAIAAVPSGVLPALGAAELPALWRQAAQEEGLSGPETELACRSWVEEVPLCFRVEEKKRRRWVTQEDLVLWQTNIEEVEAVATSALKESPFVERTVHGGSRHYFSVETVAGREAVVVLHPQWLEALGKDMVLAVPARDAVLAWPLGDPELDKIMAVGVRKLFESSEVPVSRKIFTWDGTKWVVRGEVAPAQASGTE